MFSLALRATDLQDAVTQQTINSCTNMHSLLPFTENMPKVTVDEKNFPDLSPLDEPLRSSSKNFPEFRDKYIGG